MKKKFKIKIIGALMFIRYVIVKETPIKLFLNYIRNYFRPYPFNLWLILKKVSNESWYEIWIKIRNYSKFINTDFDLLSLFDSDWYAKTYKIGNELNPLKHYLYEGWNLDFDPSPMFSTVGYFELNISDKRQNPLLQYYEKQILGVSVQKTFSSLVSRDAKNLNIHNNIRHLNKKPLVSSNLQKKVNVNIAIILESVFGDVEQSLISILDQDIEIEHIYILTENTYSFQNIFQSKVTLISCDLDELLKSLVAINPNYLVVYSGQKVPKNYFTRALEILSISNTNMIGPKILYSDNKVSIGHVVSYSGISIPKVIDQDVAELISETNYLPNLGGLVLMNIDEKSLSEINVKWYPRGNGEYVYFSRFMQNEKFIKLHDQFVMNSFEFANSKSDNFSFFAACLDEHYLMQQITTEDLRKDKYRDYIRQPILIVVKGKAFKSSCKIIEKLTTDVKNLGFKLIESSQNDQELMKSLDGYNDGVLILSEIDFKLDLQFPIFSGKNVMLFNLDHGCFRECLDVEEIVLKEKNIDNNSFNFNRHYYAKFFEITTRDEENIFPLLFRNTFIKTWTQLGLIPPNNSFIKPRIRVD
jgi:hypothetical protein